MIPSVELKNIEKIYPSNIALSGVNLQIEKGEIFGLLGPNGAGKTSLIKIIMGFSTPTSGTFSILGSEHSNWQSRINIGYLPEKIAIHAFLTPVEFLKMSGKLNGMEDSALRQRIPEVLEKVNLAKQKDLKAGIFSKGMLQRLGLAASILTSPEILLLDEPGSGLDPVGIVELREIILAEKKRGATILINSHRLSEVEKICDRVGIINRGKLLATGPLSALKSGSKKITFTIANNTERMSESILNELKTKGLIPIMEKNQYTVIYEADDQIRLLPSWIVNAGADLVKYEKQNESLEEIFMRVVTESQEFSQSKKSSEEML